MSTSTERMRLKRMRELGELPPLPQCKACGKTMKLQKKGSNKASEQGLCHACWRKTPEYKVERARQNSKLRGRQHQKDVWPIAYWGGLPDAEPVRYPSARKAHSASYAGKGKPSGPVVICWSDGRVIAYWGRSAASLLGISPEDGDHVFDDPHDFHQQLKGTEKVWFDC